MTGSVMDAQLFSKFLFHDVIQMTRLNPGGFAGTVLSLALVSGLSP
jgi:hypothetical protein